jgi:hypothetical protein
MADDEPIPAEMVEAKASVEERKADAEMRSILSDTYTFVRSAEINKTILSFTFDHYIDEAKRTIKEDRVLRSASDPVTGVGKRPSKLSALEKLEQDFNKALEKIRKLAEAKDAPTTGSPS